MSCVNRTTTTTAIMLSGAPAVVEKRRRTGVGGEGMRSGRYFLFFCDSWKTNFCAHEMQPLACPFDVKSPGALFDEKSLSGAAATTMMSPASKTWPGLMGGALAPNTHCCIEVASAIMEDCCSCVNHAMSSIVCISLTLSDTALEPLRIPDSMRRRNPVYRKRSSSFALSLCKFRRRSCIFERCIMLW